MLLPLALAKGDVLPSFFGTPAVLPKTLPCAPSPLAQECGPRAARQAGPLAFGPDALRLAALPGLLAARRQALSRQQAASQFPWSDRVDTGPPCALFPLGNQSALKVSWQSDFPRLEGQSLIRRSLDGLSAGLEGLVLCCSPSLSEAHTLGD